MSRAAFRAIARGCVQGVGYRYFVLRNAQKLGIAGYTKNLDDGSVEVGAEGERMQLDQLLLRLKIGPRGARVDGVEVEWVEDIEKYGGFEIRF